MQIRHAFLSTAAIIAPALFVPQTAHAQSQTLDLPPIRQPLDENGVDLSSGGIAVPSSRVGIGGAEGLQHSRYRVGNGWRHNYMLAIEVKPGQIPDVYVLIGGSRRWFAGSSSNYVAQQGEGGTLSENANEFIYTDAGGTVYTFAKAPVANGQSYYGSVAAVGTKIRQPDGRETYLTYRNDSYTYGVSIGVVRLQSVTNNTGYQLKFGYAANTVSSTTVDNWYQITKVTAINNAVEYCGPAADSCALSTQWPFLSYSTAPSGTDEIETVTDVLARSSQLRFDAGDRLKGVKRPGESTEGMTVDYDSDSRVQQVTRQNSYERYYAWDDTTYSGFLVATSTDQLSRERIVKTNLAGQVVETSDALGYTTYYFYDSDNRLYEVIAPEGNKVRYTRDARGRVVRTEVFGKTGGTPITTEATYLPLAPGTGVCAAGDRVVCDKPLTTTDALGNVTDYQWYHDHGGLLSVTAPAPHAGAARPQTRISYTPRQAYFYQAGGTLGYAAPIQRLLSISSCRSGTAATCSGTAEERIVQFSFDPAVPGDGRPAAMLTSPGDYSLHQWQAMTYHRLGGIETMDGPVLGSEDITTTHYDLAGQVIATIGPDPDGAGANPRLATRMIYNADGQVTIAESGRVDGTSAADVAAMALNIRSLTTYDDFGRVATQGQVHVNGWLRNTLVQQSYDIAGRPTCTATRMNVPDLGTAFPADACVQTDPSNPADRISASYYNVADQVIEARSAVGSPLEQISAKLAYTPNGVLDWVEDAEQNRTDYVQDNFDRVTEIQYPSKTQKNVANPADNEIVTYLADGSIQTHTTRMDETFAFTYDDLGRLIHRDMPGRSGLTLTQTRDTFFAYDNFGAMTEARFDSPTGPSGVFFSYDALGRLAQEQNTVSGIARTLGYQYDVAGRRTRLTYPDGAFVTYSYDALSRPTGVWRQGTDAVRTWAYDVKGQLADIGPAIATGFAYDDYGRMIVKQHYAPSAAGADDYRLYTYNRANQIEDATLYTSLPAWDGHAPVNVDYTANGLNQYTQVNANAYTYDANGNLTGDGTDSFTYDPANRLIAMPSKGATLAYDPLGRLHSVTDASGTERFLYDGDALIAEYNAGGTMLARHVHGLSAGDDPLASYSGSLFDASNEQLIRTDRLGSVLMMSTDRTANGVSVNTYDEYGVPGSGNSGRFQYTGQVWLPQLGLYHYKARTYSPTLGRFLQTDPIGYGDGLNMYAYVGNDPVNGIDPSGMSCTVMGRIEEWGTYTDTNGNGQWDPGEPKTPGGKKIVDMRCVPNLFPEPQFGNPGLGDFLQDGVAPKKGQCGVPSRGQRKPPNWPAAPGYSKAESTARQIASEEVARTQRITNNYRLGGHNDIYDAERHARWTYRMARTIGPGWARLFSNGHELESASFLETRMDLNNNDVGLDAARDGTGIPTRSTPNLTYIRNGELVRRGC